VARVNLGVVLARQGLVDAAAAEYRRALVLEPDNAIAHNNLGAILLARRLVLDARAEFQRAIRSNPRYAEAEMHLARTYAAEDNAKAAAEHYRAAVGLRGAPVDALIELAWLCATARDPAVYDPKSALTFARRAVDVGGMGKAAALDVLAASFAAAGRFDEAAAAVREAIALQPDGADAELMRRRMAVYATGSPLPPQLARRP
jgi:tetratricopeptide (TPR) repeat protein